MKPLSPIDIEVLVTRFFNQKLPRDQWTHEAHLTVGLWHVKTYGFTEAVCRLKSGIILLNQSNGVENTAANGYHETITIFWAKVLEQFVNANAGLTGAELFNAFLQSNLADSALPFQYYDREKLLSPEYRAMYVAPEREVAL